MATTKKNKKNFSSFVWATAFKEIGLEKLREWSISFTPLPPSDFLQERLQRLKKFDLISSERAKELIIDAFCEEVAVNHLALKIWKAATVDGDDLTGVADYVVAPDRGYLDTPLLCVAEAKKDDFEQGLAQCLVEMKACQQRNARDGGLIEIYGIVTNGGTWQFYKMTTAGEVWETPPHSIGDLESVLGGIHHVFTLCEEQLNIWLTRQN